MQIIVNADDLGCNAQVNSAICDLIAQGHITSSTLLANGAALEDAVSRIQKYKDCSFGVHLNLTEFRPLTTCTGLFPLLDMQGNFVADRVRSVPINYQLREAIFQEWSAQIQRLAALGVVPSHIDSHHHVHTIPWLFPVIKRVQRRFGIRKVRISMNIYPVHTPAAHAQLLRKTIWNFILRHYYSTVTTGGFTSFAVFFELMQRQCPQHHSVELMAHPGHPAFQEESQLLASSWWKRLPCNTQLISYNNLVK